MRYLASTITWRLKNRRLSVNLATASCGIHVVCGFSQVELTDHDRTSCRRTCVLWPTGQRSGAMPFARRILVEIEGRLPAEHTLMSGPDFSPIAAELAAH